MRIDRKQFPWAVFSAIVLAASWWWYAQYSATRLNGPSGGSWQGIVFGAIGSAFILFAGLLGVRKYFRRLRWPGSAQFWMRAHLWLGTIALPLIWFHAGFHHGGLLTSILMWLFYITVISGILGAILQHVLPHRMMRLVPNEVTYQQIPRVLQHLAAEADHLVACYCGPMNGEDLAAWRTREMEVLRFSHDRYVIDADRRAALEAAVAAAPAVGAEVLRDFYRTEVQPVLRGDAPHSPLLLPGRAEVRFHDQRLMLPQPLHAPLADLRRIWDRRVAVLMQQRLQRWMYGWLFVHVPVSYALIVLSVVHAVMALRYSL